MKAWTPEQKSAVEAKGKQGDILVTAAAGSGKTSVLTARVIRKITEEGYDIDRLLIVTFTKAAAAEMRERIEKKLSQLLSQNPFDRNLLRQRLLLKKAKICTIDSFCTEMLRENFQEIGIGRDFRIVEENEYSLLVSQTAEELLEEYYKKADEDFNKTADFFLSDRSDAQLKGIIICLNSFLSSYAFPEKWLLSAEQEIKKTGDLNSDIWGKKAVQLCRDDISFAISLASYALILSELAEETKEKYYPAIEEDLSRLNALYEVLTDGSFTKVREAINNMEFASVKAVRNAELEWLKNHITDYRKKYKDIVTKNQEKLFCFSEDSYIKDRSDLRAVALMLLKMTRELDSRLFERKREENFLSFSDLGRLCVRVLLNNQQDGIQITDTAKDYARRFDEILIDEYQDTNEVQDMIFKAISRDNRFMVGDVKQSIYAFRDADPTVFAKKKDAFLPYDGKAFPAKISLNANFRSRKDVTDFVNFVFSQTMSRELGGIEYAEDALYPLAQYPQTDEIGVEIDLIESDKETALTEAQFIARKIKNTVNSGFKVSDGNGGLRPVRYGDFAVLYRSLNNKKAAIMRAFANEAVKINIDASSGLFSTYEILTVTELLKAIDNPRRDVSLASAMMSPAFGFSEDEMANIRIYTENKLCFYDAVKEYAKNDSKTAEFLQELSSLRSLSAGLKTDEFLIALYIKTGIKDAMRASRGGELKAANLELLITHAKSFEETGKTGLSAFLRYIAKVRENGGDSAMSSVCSGEDDAVNVMSIHKSKGLEFPVVIAAGLGGRFNLMDANASTLLHKKLFLGSKIKTGEMIRDTLPHAVLHRHIISELVAEELRVLYVAMTRAKEKLILTAAKVNIKESAKRAAELCLTDGMIKAYSKSVTSMLEWIIAAFLRHPDGGYLRDLLQSDILPIKTEGRVSFNIIDELPEAEEIQMEKELKNEADADTSKLYEKFSWVYPFANEQNVPTKISVTALSHEGKLKASRPKFITERDELTGAEKGTATHLFMSFCRLNLTDIAQIEDELNRLTDGKFITKEQAEAVDRESVLKFFEGEIGEMLKAAPQIYREYNFQYEMNANEVSSDYPADASVLVSGTADLIIITQDKTVIVDYKTDKVEKPEELILRYKNQLDLYEKALSKHFGKKTQKIIYSFALKQSIKL